MSATKQQDAPTTHQSVEVGYAIREMNGGYFDINGIGDWSLAGTPMTCEVFPSVAEANQCIADNDLDEDDCEVVAVNRVAAVVVSALSPSEQIGAA